MIASLPMYNWGDAEAAHDRLWSLVRNGLRAAGVDAPDALTRGGDLWDQWTAPDLLLSQTCGMPFRTRLHPTVTLVGTPDYHLEGCAPGWYCSHFIARADDPRADLAAFQGATLAYSSPDSQSGWAAPMNESARLGLRFRLAPMTGSHRQSALMVAEGGADIAAIDAATWRMYERQSDIAGRLRVLASTPPTPGLPIITAYPELRDMIFSCLHDAFAALEPAERAALGMHGIVAIPVSDYLAVPNPPPPDRFV